MRYVVLLVLLLGFTAPVHAGSDDVTFTCTWRTLDENIYETFVIDLKKKTILWVNEEERIEASEFNESFILFSGTKTHVHGNYAEHLTEVDIEMKIDRVSGAFHVLSDQVKALKIGECVIGKLF